MNLYEEKFQIQEDIETIQLALILLKDFDFESEVETYQYSP